jgi:hypothetical protein
MDNGELTDIISLDIRKAFHFLDQKILSRKMHEQDMELKLVPTSNLIYNATLLILDVLCAIREGGLLSTRMSHVLNY